MPKRSNAFQQVVMLLHKQFQENGIITESKNLADSLTGESREVDIVIEVKISNYPVTISIECINYGRPATVEWVERMFGKHRNLPTDKLVLVSKSGFSKNAEIKAKALNIGTLSLKEAENTYWPDIVAIETLIAKYEGFLIVQRDDGIKLLPASRDWLLYSEKKELVFPVSALIEKLIKNPEVGAVFSEKMDKDKKTENNFTVDYNFPYSLFCKDPKNQEFEVLGFRLMLSAKKSITPIPLSHGDIEGINVAFGETTDKTDQIQAAFLKKDDQDMVVEIRKKDGGNWLNLIKMHD